MKALDEPFDPEELSAVEGMDCLKLEFTRKSELTRHDLAVLKGARFEPKGRGCVWPQFRSTQPGWHPWYITQTEADAMLADLPRLIAFYRLFEKEESLFDGHPPLELPFLAVELPERALTPGDLDWRPCLRIAEPQLAAYTPDRQVMEQLLRIVPSPGLVCEFDSLLMAGASFVEEGRPCFGRLGLLAQSGNGVVLGLDIQPGALSAGYAAGASLVGALLKAGRLPAKLILRDPRWRPVVEPFCATLGIQIGLARRLPAFEEALASVSQFISNRQGR